MTQKPYLYFDSASTTQCGDIALKLMLQYIGEDFGNPSSGHAFGQRPAKAIREAREFFSEVFQVEPDQIIFTGSGTEANNLAISGIIQSQVIRNRNQKTENPPIVILTSSTEHPSVEKVAQSWTDFGIQHHLVPVDSTGQIIQEKYCDLLANRPHLVSFHQVNNIVGTLLPVEELARQAKEKWTDVIFHADAIQSFGKVPLPRRNSAIDLLSISGHKIHGPKGVGALIILNRKLLQKGFRPLLWGGDQENGFRSGTQNAGLIAGFHEAAKQALFDQKRNYEHVSSLRDELREQLSFSNLLNSDFGGVSWNSPPNAIPHIINLSIPSFPAGPMSKLLEERGNLVSTGSACHSHKSGPDRVLSAMNLQPQVLTSAIRISLSKLNTKEEIAILVRSLKESIQVMSQLLGKSRKAGNRR